MKRILFLYLVLFASLSFGQANKTLSWLQSPPYATQYQDVLNNYSGELPSAYQQSLGNAFIRALVSSGVWAKTSQLRIPLIDGSANFGDVNQANPSGNKAIRTNNVQFGVNNGFKFGGTADVWSQNWIPSGDALFTQNNAEFAIYCEDIRLNSSGIDGVTDGTSLLTFNPQQTAGAVRASINQSTTGTFTDAQFDLSPGLYFIGRASSSQSYARKNGNARVTISTTSNGRSSRTFNIGGFDNNGSFSQYNNRKVFLFWAGSALTVAEENAFYAAWTNYLNGVRNQTNGGILGTRYSATSWSNLSDFTNNTASATIVSNKIHLSGGATNNSQYLQLNIGSMNAHWKMVIGGTITTKDATSVGFAAGTISVSSQSTRNYGWGAYFDGSTGAQTGTTRLESAGNGLSFGSVNGSSAATFAATDQIETTFETFGTNVTATTKINGVYVNQAFSAGSVTLSRLNTFMPTIFSKGGAIDINSFSYTVYEKIGAKYLFLGDSKTYGIGATDYNDGFPRKFANDQFVTVNAGGASDRSGEYLQHMDEIIALKPRNIVLVGISNDLRFGTASGTWQANVTAIITRIQTDLPTCGIYIINGLYETSGLDQTPFDTWLLANYPAYRVNLLSTVITLSDTIHPDTGGHATIATALSGILPRSVELIINESGYGYNRSTEMRGPIRTRTNREKMKEQNIYQDF